MGRKKFKSVAVFCCLVGLFSLGLAGAVRAQLPKPPDEVPFVGVSTADHSRFPELDKPFASGPEVTRACLKCHNRAADQVKKTLHWTWESVDESGRKVLGKAHVLNNY